MRSGTTLVLVAAFLGGCGARTGVLGGDDGDGGADAFPDSPLLPPTLSCSPAESWTTIGRAAVAYGEADDDGWISQWQWTVAESPEGSGARPEPAQAPTSSFTPDAEGDYILEVVATDNEGLSASCRVTVHSVVGPPLAFCPEDVEEARVGRPYTLEADAFDDEAVVSFSWTVTQAPDGSTAMATPPNEPVTVFTPDVTGDYELTFAVVDNDGQETSCAVVLAASGAPEAICPPDATVPTRRPHPLRGDAEDDGEIVAWTWELVERPDRSEVIVEGSTQRRAELVPDRVGRYRLRLTVTDDTGLTASCETVVDATPSAPEAICPDRVRTTPLTEITLRGDGEDDGRIVQWLWELLETPAASAAEPPSPSDEQVTYFMPDAAGEYVLLLTVFDDEGMQGSCEVTVLATPGEGLRVELYWNPPDRSCPDVRTPGCDSSDVDLHLLHPDGPSWFTNDFDCHYANCQYEPLEWDISGSADNPRLDLDDVEGFGPENINIDEPIIGHVYQVGVHYYDSDSWRDATEAYVNVYCGRLDIDPVYTVGPVSIHASGGYDRHDFWRVATVEWNGVTCEVTPRFSPAGGPDIIPTELAQTGR